MRDWINRDGVGVGDRDKERGSSRRKGRGRMGLTAREWTALYCRGIWLRLEWVKRVTGSVRA